MNFLQLIILLVFLTGCDSKHEVENSAGVNSGVVNLEVTNSAVIDSAARLGESAVKMGSFRMGNNEIREEMIAEFVKQGIQHWVNDDKIISYLLSDGEKIDLIGNEIILSYISRN
jgi:hypothetical protein